MRQVIKGAVVAINFVEFIALQTDLQKLIREVRTAIPKPRSGCGVLFGWDGERTTFYIGSVYKQRLNLNPPEGCTSKDWAQLLSLALSNHLMGSPEWYVENDTSVRDAYRLTIRRQE